MRAVAALVLASASLAHADGAYELHGIASVGQTWVNDPYAGTTWADGPVLEVGYAQPAWPDTTVGIAIAIAHVSVPPANWQCYSNADYDQLSIGATIEHHVGRFAYSAELGLSMVSRTFDNSGSSDTGVLLGAGAHVALDIVTVGRGKVDLVLGGRVAPLLESRLLAQDIYESFATITLGVGYRL